MPNSNGGRAPAAIAPDLGPDALVYIEKVRQTTRRLSAREPGGEDLSGAVQAVRNVATFDVEVPVASRRREFEIVKTGIKRLSVWYMRYLAQQLNAFGRSVSDLGDALAKRTEALASLADDLEVRVGAVEERLKRLESARPPSVKRATVKPATVEPATPRPTALGPRTSRKAPQAKNEK